MSPISRPTRSLDSNAARPLKASAPRSSGTAGEGSSNSGPASGIKPKEEPLVGYLMARAAMHRKVENPEVRNLRAGHASVQHVCNLLPLGRANVIEDIWEAGETYLPLRKLAAQKMFKSMERQERLAGRGLDEAGYNRLGAAVSQFAETGVCSTFAMSTTPLHAAKLAGMHDERSVVSYVENRRANHGWAEMLPKGKNEKGVPILHGDDVIMDGWCTEKVAILREDSNFARLDKDGKANRLSHQDLLNHETGPEALRQVEEYKARIRSSPDLQLTFQREFNRLVDKKDISWMNGLWNDTSVFHPDFPKQAGKALHKDAKDIKAALDAMAPSPGKDGRVLGADPVLEQSKRAFMAEIHAVGVARSLGADYPGAIAEAPGILASARKMFPAPDTSPSH